jgi:hypothetical protein
VYDYIKTDGSTAVEINPGLSEPAIKVGALGQFQVDLNGNLKRVNDVPYSFPSTQGSSGQTLLNDGSGSLNWSGLLGDVNGPINITRVSALQHIPISPTAPQDGEVLKYDSGTGEWKPGTVSGGGGTTGQNILGVFGGTSLTVTPATTTFTPIPGLQQTVNIPASNSVIYISTDGGVQCNGGTVNSVSIVDIALFIDGAMVTDGAIRRIVAANLPSIVPMVTNWSMGVTETLSPGSHNIDLRVKNGSGGTSAAIVSGDTNSVLQGQITVTVINR